MPKKVSSLDLRNRSEITNAFQVMVTNPTDYQLFRVPVTQFRGASTFTGTLEPSITPEDPLINEYVDGDVYIRDTSEGQLLYVWNADNVAWDDPTKLNGLRLLTATDFPEEVNLDTRFENFIDDSVFANDYYLNKSIDILYGPYDPTTGFKFSSIDFSGYQGFRAPKVFEYQGNDTDGYDNPRLYLASLLADAGVTDRDKVDYRRPIHQDTIHIKLETDEGHGGWNYYFDTTIEATGSTLLENYNLLLGTNVAGDLPTVKQHARDIKTWNETGIPVQNDNKYRQGDNVFSLDQGILYYNYQEGLPANTVDLGVLFEGQTILAGSSLKSALDINGAWIAPTTDDGSYKQGDFIFTREGNTPRIHGPYSFGEAEDHLSWPLYAVLRTPIKHRYKYDSPKLTDYSATGAYYPYQDGTMIVEGDFAVDVYVNDPADINNQSVIKKEITRVEGCTIDYVNSVVTWGEGRVNRDATTIHTSTAVGEPSVDVINYYDNDIVRNKIGDLYRFNEDFDTPLSSTFTLLDGIRANVTHVADTTSTNFVPDTTQNSSQWGGGTVQDEDTLEVRWTGSTNNKVVLYTAEVNETTGEIAWLYRRSLYGQREFSSTSFTTPLNDNTEYTTDDYIIDASGRKHIYDESLNTNTGGWTFSGWARTVETFVTEKDNSYTPTINGSDFLNGGTEVDVTSKRLREGDEIHVYVVDGGVRTGKQYVYQVLTENPVTFSDRVNPNVTKFAAEASPSRNNRNDLVYSTGDFIDNPSTGWRYGPYVEGAADNATAWPDFVEIKQTPIYTDATTALDWKIKVDDNEFYFEEQ